MVGAVGGVEGLATPAHPTVADAGVRANLDGLAHERIATLITQRERIAMVAVDLAKQQTRGVEAGVGAGAVGLAKQQTRGVGMGVVAVGLAKPAALVHQHHQGSEQHQHHQGSAQDLAHLHLHRPLGHLHPVLAHHQQQVSGCKHLQLTAKKNLLR
jgi:hypothetical protein